MDNHQNKVEKVFEKRLELIKYLEKYFPTELLQRYNEALMLPTTFKEFKDKAEYLFSRREIL